MRQNLSLYDRSPQPPARYRQVDIKREFDLRTHAEERTALGAFSGTELGEPFDVGASPEELVVRMLGLLGPLISNLR